MLKIAIYCVNYHSYEALQQYRSSIDSALKGDQCAVEVEMFIADNTEHDVQTIAEDEQRYHVKVFPYHQNLGYFGAVRKLMQETSPTAYDYAIISNVDLMIDEHFFQQLTDEHVKVKEQIGWISPQIFSKTELRDKNPKILQRYAKGKLQLLRLMYGWPFLYYLYTHTLYRSKKVLMQHEARDIYAGHGSFIILTRSFFEQCGIINYPMFLFDEEIYLAEQCREKGLRVVYRPSIKVIDNEHASTGRMPSKFYFACNYQATVYILKTYYC